MLAERRFDTGEVELNYAEGPDAGPPLVMVHGGASHWQAFETIIPALAARWHVYALDTLALLLAMTCWRALLLQHSRIAGRL